MWSTAKPIAPCQAACHRLAMPLAFRSGSVKSHSQVAPHFHSSTGSHCSRSTSLHRTSTRLHKHKQLLTLCSAASQPRCGKADKSPDPHHEFPDNLADDENIILLGSEDEEDYDTSDFAGSAITEYPSAAPSATILAPSADATTVRGRVISSDMSEDEFRAAMTAAREDVVSGSSSSSDEWADEGMDDEDDDWRRSGDDFWSTDKERVYLVGVAYKQQYQQQQLRRQEQQQQQQRQRLFDSPSNLNVPRGCLGMTMNGNGQSDPWSVADAADPSSSSSSSSNKQPVVTYNIQESIEELGRLAETAGLKVVGSTHQQLEAPNNATYIGSGKVAEVSRAVAALKVDTVIFDDELSPGQLRNLEKAFSGGREGAQVAVADRTALILDIFSQRARTREGKLQVELAQTEYQLPRLTRMWTHLDRVTGGGQVKGTGEKQIEIDKRLLRDKAAALRRELQAVRTHRAAHRSRRSDAPIPVVALVGYTNAGKSTLLNTLTAAGVLAEDKLFATLDPTTRKVRLDGNLEVLFSDTVGFIQKLPTQLVAAFRATLEEIAAASVVLHVLDVSAPNAAAQCAAVLQVLEELGVQDLPLVTAWNKIDACGNPDAVRALAASRSDTVAISGATGEGMDDLLAAIAEKLAESMVEMEVLLPYSAGALLDDVHKMGKVTDTQYTEQGTRITAHVPRCLVGKLEQYSISSLGANGSAGSSASILHDSLLDDGDNGQLGSYDDLDDYVMDYSVENASFEDVQIEPGWEEGSDIGTEETSTAASSSTATGWGEASYNSRQQQQAGHDKDGYQPHVAGSRAGKRAALRKKRQQGSLAAHQLPADWQQLLQSGSHSESSSMVSSMSTL